MKPYAEACDENKAPILAVLLRLFRDVRIVLEIGSGTGQHAVHFAAAMPQITWQTSDVEQNHLLFSEDLEMPVNNRILVWHKGF